MMKIISFILLLVIFSSDALAATATSSADTATRSATPSQSQDLQEKIKNLVRENLSATESAVRDRINQKTLVGYSGKIKSINSDHLSISTGEDTLLQITTDENTEIIKSGAAIKFSSLAISDKTIVIGTILKDDIIIAKRIVIVPTPDDSVMTTSTVVSKISSIDIKKKTIGLTINNEEVVYTLTKKSTIKLDDLNTGDTIFAITKKYEGKDYISRAKSL